MHLTILLLSFTDSHFISINTMWKYFRQPIITKFLIHFQCEGEKCDASLMKGKNITVFKIKWRFNFM